MADKPDEGAIRQPICEARTIIEGEDQLPRYVARLELAECAEKISAASPIRPPSLAAERDECRVEKDLTRNFEQVIRVWTLHVLSGLECSWQTGPRRPPRKEFGIYRFYD